MRLVSIGHESARFEDVTLKFADRAGQPTNSVLWLRNGGGKTSLLSLFFAGVRPHQRDFLGKRADEKVRGIEDYVRPRDHAVVVCEWQLDAERGLFDDNAPCYLSGVFYERSASHAENGSNAVERLYFASLVSPSVPELSLEGLPLFTDDRSRTSRRSLHGFRRRMRQLNSEHPALEVFLGDKQNTFEEELSSRGIDPDVFYYQIRMNEREGGVSERFSFAQDEDFVDFLLEIAFDSNRAREVREQLTTFRQQLMERNEQLKPELEYCRGLIVRLGKMARVAQERSGVFLEVEAQRHRLEGLSRWVGERVETLKAETKRIDGAMHDALSGEDESRHAGDRSYRTAAVFQQHACQLRFDSIDSDYVAAEQEHTNAKRLQNIWKAARPLARVGEARRRAKALREQLANKLEEHAPQLAELTRLGTRLVNAIDFEVKGLRATESEQRRAAESLRTKAASAREEAETAGENAATAEAHVGRLEDLLRRADAEMQQLRTTGSVLDQEPSAEAAAERIKQELERLADQLREQEESIETKKGSRNALAAEAEDAARSLRDVEKDLAELEGEWKRANEHRVKLEDDASLLRLLQTDKVDVPSAASRAVNAASEELRRVVETILRIRLEAAESVRAIHWLEGDAALLPPSKDAAWLLTRLREQGISCWSGWEYIERNVSRAERRHMVERLPYLATGIVVANPHYELVVDLFEPGEQAEPLDLTSPVVILPADAVSDRHDLTWTVVGPSSDGHFDKQAAAFELNRLCAAESRRESEVQAHETWQEELSALRERLRAFLSEFPTGWFGSQRQKIEVCEARREEAREQCTQIAKQLKSLDTDLERAESALKVLWRQHEDAVRHQDRVKAYLRQYGVEYDSWMREIAEYRRSANRLRSEQRRHKELEAELAKQAWDCERIADDSASRASHLERESAEIKYVDDNDRESATGPVESLRADYHTLLADYDGKVNADALSQLADEKDREAGREQREFERVLGQFEDIDADDVAAALSQLPAGMTAEMRSEQADRDATVALQRLGTIANRRNPAKQDVEKAKAECDDLRKSAPLPEVTPFRSVGENEEAARRHRREADEHFQLASEFNTEVDDLAEKLLKGKHEGEMLGKDAEGLRSISENHGEQFQRLEAYAAAGTVNQTGAEPAIRIKDTGDLAEQIRCVDSSLQQLRARQQSLDKRRDEISGDVARWSQREEFTKRPASICHRFAARGGDELERKAEFYTAQLDDTVFQIEEKLKEANKHHARVVDIVLSAVEEGLHLLKRVSSMSRLPEGLPQAGKQFVVIETKASDNPIERRARVADLIDELLESGDIGDGLALIQKGVRRVAVRTKVRVLHPDLQHATKRIGISEMRSLSGGERLTSAILLYCALVRLRHLEKNRRGSSVLILDNPIGTASRVSFLDLQREVAQAMNVQLIYATGVADLNAVGALENVIRLRNTRADRRTGKRLVEVDGDGEWIGRVEATRVAFDAPPGSVDGRHKLRAGLDPSNEESPVDVHGH